jgi:hypothetical protein
MENKKPKTLVQKTEIDMYHQVREIIIRALTEQTISRAVSNQYLQPSHRLIPSAGIKKKPSGVRTSVSCLPSPFPTLFYLILVVIQPFVYPGG